ncbi:MAG: NUDIX hydrolase [Candidatus Uhrbacteria bacterium]|nr:NUDIX hydrolase [Candidatus Uhrbacteria bacterium]
MLGTVEIATDLVVMALIRNPDGDVWLGEKWKGNGRRVNAGGHFEPGRDASFRHTAVREVKEETHVSIRLQSLTHVASVRFIHLADDETVRWIVTSYIYGVTTRRLLRDSDEIGNFRRYRPEALPLDRMYPSDIDWMVRAMDGGDVVEKCYTHRKGLLINTQPFDVPVEHRSLI